MLYVEIRYTTVNLGNLQILFLMLHGKKKNHGIINVRAFFFVKSKFKPLERFKLAACEDNTQKLDI